MNFAFKVSKCHDFCQFCKKIVRIKIFCDEIYLNCHVNMKLWGQFAIINWWQKLQDHKTSRAKITMNRAVKRCKSHDPYSISSVFENSNKKHTRSLIMLLASPSLRVCNFGCLLVVFWMWVYLLLTVLYKNSSLKKKKKRQTEIIL